VTEFVQQHACKERDNEQHARDSSSRAADLIIGETNPRQEQQEGDMDTNFGAGNTGDLERPSHRIQWVDIWSAT
jgi:hypothetical protein